MAYSWWFFNCVRSVWILILLKIDFWRRSNFGCEVNVWAPPHASMPPPSNFNKSTRKNFMPKSTSILIFNDTQKRSIWRVQLSDRLTTDIMWAWLKYPLRVLWNMGWWLRNLLFYYKYFNRNIFLKFVKRRLSYWSFLITKVHRKKHS